MTESEKTEFIAKLLIGKKKGGSITEWARIGKCIVGTRIGDRYDPIKTSNIVKMHDIEGQLIAETLNSYYYLLEEGTEIDFYANLADYQSIKENIEQVMEKGK